MVAELAGAHAEAADGAMARTEMAATARTAVRAFRCIDAPRFVVTPSAGTIPKTGEREPRSAARGPRLYFPRRAAVAQLARASACHAEGRGFESHQPLARSPLPERVFRFRGSRRASTEPLSWSAVGPR